MGCPKITYDYQEEGLEKSTVHFFGQLAEKRGQQKNRINYYPGGLTFNNYERTASSPQRFKFQQKEWLEDGLNLYDFSARMYDPAIWRTSTMDPLADAFYDQSPYSFQRNNPISLVDPTGMAPSFFDDGGDDDPTFGPGMHPSGTMTEDEWLQSSKNCFCERIGHSSGNGGNENGGNDKPQTKPGVVGFGTSGVSSTLGVTDIIAGGISLYGAGRAAQFGGVAAKMPTVFLGSATGAHIFVEDPRLISGFKNAGLQTKSNSFLARSMSYSKVASFAKWLGVGAAIGGTAFDISQTISFYRNGGIDGGQRAGTSISNTIFTSIGIFGGAIGWATSGSYFIMSSIAEPQTPFTIAWRQVQLKNRLAKGRGSRKVPNMKIGNPKREP